MLADHVAFTWALGRKSIFVIQLNAYLLTYFHFALSSAYWRSRMDFPPAEIRRVSENASVGTERRFWTIATWNHN